MFRTFVAFLVVASASAETPQSLRAEGVTSPLAEAAGRAANYHLGNGDELKIRMMDVDELDKSVVRVDSDGDITLPFVGRVHAKGETVASLEDTVRGKLKRFYRDPLFSITVTEYKSRPVSVIGSVMTPGVVQLRDHERLLDAISGAGGLREDADTRVQLMRKAAFGKIPLDIAAWDSENEFSTADIDLSAILSGKDTTNNVQLMPEDTISVSKARMIYVIGEVHKPGGFVLKESTPMSVLTALSMAEGLSRYASPGNARILRQVAEGAPRKEIPTDVRRILAGKGADIPLLPDDIIVVPNNVPKSAALRSIEAAIQIGTGVAIFRR